MMKTLLVVLSSTGLAACVVTPQTVTRYDAKCDVEYGTWC